MNYRRLRLLALDWTRPKDPPLSLGHASIFTNLQHQKVNVDAVSWSVNAPTFSTDDVVKNIMENADDRTDIALGAFVWNENAIQDILGKLKKTRFPGRILLGGPQISYMKDDVSPLYPQVDIFVRGYAENALAQLFRSPDKFPLIEGITYKDAKLSQSHPKPANVNFDELRSPFLDGVIKPQPFLRWETQRGCPFRCSFCQHRQPDAVTRTRRDLPLSRAIQEAQWITDHPVIQDIAVLDPVFNSGGNYLALLDTLIEGKYSGKLSLQCRLELTTDEFLEKVQRLNETGRVVLEFGLQTIHLIEMKYINRKNNLPKVSRVLQATKARNIETEISLIFGLPGQTVQSFQETIDFCKEHDVTRLHAFPLMLLRGTPLHEYKDTLKLVESSDMPMEAGILSEASRVLSDIPHVIASPSFTVQDWLQMYQTANSLNAYNTRTSTSTSTS
jgi:radical SAM superfamily enzyme YgiQ (UPF0313 family)